MRLVAGVLAGGLALILASCGGTPDGGEASRPSGILAANKTAATVAELPVIDGLLVYGERLVLPPPTVARVQLVRLGPHGAARTVLAEAEVLGPLASPIPFVLPYRPPSQSLMEGERFSLMAMISLYGEVLFTSVVPVRVHLPPRREETPVVVPLMGRWGAVSVSYE